MNKLDALIAELCPQGVERKRLGDIGVVVRGNGLQKKDFTESGVGCIHYGRFILIMEPVRTKRNHLYPMNWLKNCKK